MTSIESWLAGLNRRLLLFISLLLVFVIGGLDVLTGYELAFSLFYVLSISLVTWYTNPRLGLLTSAISALVWLAADILSGNRYSTTVIPVWNSCIRFSFFAIITWLLSSLQASVKREGQLARTDFLTEAVNSRQFHNLAQMELERFRRYGHPFTIAYLDLDNFKAVNDHLGHAAGDQALRVIVECAQRHLRKTDIVARLGGDEFALFLPETDLDATRIAITKVQTALVRELLRHNWPITFSIGVLTCCREAPATSDELVNLADRLMYQAKHESKNATLFSSFSC